MNIEEIKEKVLYDDCGFIRLSEYCVDTILKDYYTPLAESHRELVKVLEASIEYDKSELNGQEILEGSLLHKCITALSNAKKLINE